MNAYLVVAWTYYPYKIEEQSTVKASAWSTAIGKAVRQFRRNTKLQGRRLKEISVRATLLK